MGKENSIIVAEAKKLRAEMLPKSIYKIGDQYSEVHPNALSDGDEKGRGGDIEDRGLGSEVKLRKKLLAMNTYKKGDEYRVVD